MLSPLHLARMSRLPALASRLLLVGAASVMAGCGGGGAVHSPDGGGSGGRGAGGAGGSGDNHATPRVITGGGTGDGPIAGWLNVYVIDNDGELDVPISSAAVRVDTNSATAGCTGTTDSTGLAIFDPTSCPGLRGKRTITVSAAGRVPATWLGVDAANVTVPLEAKTPAAVATATATGTIAGWQDLAPPAAGHQTLGLVGTSQSRTFGGRENELAQGTRVVLVGIIPIDVPANVCVRNALANDCNFRLTARTGPQAHVAIIIDQDTKGTDNNDTDDTFSIVGYALTRGLNLTAGQTSSGEMLARLPDGDIATTSLAATGIPSALEDILFIPIIDLGDEGRLVIPIPGKQMATGGTARVPKSTGLLAGTKFELLARAQDSATDDRPQSMVWKRSLDAAAAVNVSGFLTAPSNLMVAAGTYSFTATTGAAMHAVDIDDMTGVAQWNISIFDGSTSFTLPGLAPDPLPAGMLQFQVTGFDVPNLTPNDLHLEDALNNLARLAQDKLDFTH